MTALAPDSPKAPIRGLPILAEDYLVWLVARPAPLAITLADFDLGRSVRKLYIYK
jgi:hypothetical protein